MCAPYGVGMEQPIFSRLNSQSSRTTKRGEEGMVSPILSPNDGNSGHIPILQTTDSKQWIDLDYLSPKILKELRRQYDPSIKDEHSGSLSKSAAKVKAWARQSKFGIDIRLRRKINAEHDEVTDIHLVPDAPSPRYQRDEKLALIAELPGASNQITSELPDAITELPDTSVTLELEAIPLPSRTSTDSSIGEPLPLYEPRREPAGSVNVSNGSADRTESPDRLQGSSHHHSPSHSSIIATPKRGLSMRDTPDHSLLREPATNKIGEKVGQLSDNNAQQIGESGLNSHDGNSDDANRKLDHDPGVSQGFQALIKALQREQPQGPKSIGDSQPSSSTGSAKDVFKRLKVAATATYETETDLEPRSPIRRPVRPARKKVLTAAKRRKSVVTSKPAAISDHESESLSEDDPEAQSRSLLRRQTLPKRQPASAGVEAIWASLLRMQAKILGPEHPLTYQAKSDLARSRASGHVTGAQDMSTLRQSKELAIGTLGIAHPWVAAFSEDLSTLEELTGLQVNDELIDDRELKEYGTTPSTWATEQSMPRLASQHEGASNTMEPERIDRSETAVPEPSNNTKPAVPKIVTNLVQTQRGTLSGNATRQMSNPDNLWDSSRPPHEPRNTGTMLPNLLFGAIIQLTLDSLLWLQRNYGPEQPVEPGKVRVRWTCSCGEKMHDDFVEMRLGAARELEAYLNRPKTVIGAAGTPTTPGSSSGSRSFMSSSFGGPASSQTSWSSYNLQGSGSLGGGGDTKPPQTFAGLSSYMPYSPSPEPPWLLTCANEDRYTPKLAHLDMAPHKIRSDKDLALSLREHYFHVNKKWWRTLRLRGLTTVEFVQLEVHQNRFADIRKCPDMPPLSTGDYSFEPGDLLPPVGSQYLLHLFKHPEDYDGELITYLRAPKRNGRLSMGVGWGINLVEGFLAVKVGMVVSAFFALGSLAFVIAWACKEHDVQSASGIAAWIVSLIIVVFGWLQASLG